MKTNGMAKAQSMQSANEEIKDDLSENLKGRDHLGNLHVDRGTGAQVGGRKWYPCPHVAESKRQHSGQQNEYYQ